MHRRVRPMENWDEVRTAYQVARMGTVSGAAEVLGVHHATVIRHIDAIEALAKKHNDDIADSTSADAAFAKADATLTAAVETVTKMQGPKGDKGDTGAAGAPGAKGDPGTPGKDGKDGTGGLLQEYDITGQTCVSRTGVTGWKIVMGSNIDYFKPKPGFSFCDALKSNNGYLWAPSKLAEFVAPSPYHAHTGGSAVLWPRQHTNGVDGRKYLPFWDINSGNVGVGTNGCCHYSKTDSADWGREYKMFAW